MKVILSLQLNMDNALTDSSNYLEMNSHKPFQSFDVIIITFENQGELQAREAQNYPSPEDPVSIMR